MALNRPTNTSFVELLRNIEVPFPLPNDDRFEVDNDFGFDEPNSEYSSESLSNIGDDSDDASDIPIVNFMNDIGNVGDDDIEELDENIHIDIWKESENKITHSVHYFQHTCTCGKWQMERFPCSHALAVCRHRGDNPISIVNTVYTTVTYRQQYNAGFAPLPLANYWLDSDWAIEADYSKLSVARGRRRVNRIRNEMDIRHPDESRRCGLCHQPGHNRRSCPNAQPRCNAM